MELNQEQLFYLITKHFEKDASKIGKSNLEVIIEDFLDGGRDNINFETPTRGHHFDMVATMSLIVGLLQLLVASVDYLNKKKEKNQKKTDIQELIEYLSKTYPTEPIQNLCNKPEAIKEIIEIVENKEK